MKPIILAFVVTAALAPFARAQHISVGAAVGVPFTGGITDFTSSGVDVISHSFSNSHDYLVGPMVDIRLPLNLGIEIDALYRPVNVTTDFTVVPNPTRRSSTDPATWEFPVLGKYRLPLLPVVKPFVEAGPSFRARSSTVGYLSAKGFTLGAGLEVKILRLRIAPALRYTHWGQGGVANVGSLSTSILSGPVRPTNQNQGEFLVGFTF